MMAFAESLVIRAFQGSVAFPCLWSGCVFNIKVDAYEANLLFLSAVSVSVPSR